ncbi:MAG: glycosyltransferase [Lachnospiraceae bacterium]|nr:glycosyltransferase [Lachnospiraceae bacterium]
MRILEVGLTAHIGGMETFFHNYFLFFSPGFHFDFIGTEDGLCFSDEYLANGSNVYLLPRFKKHPIRYYLRLRKIIKNGQYDLVHINMLSAANILPLLATKSVGKKVVVHSHNNDTPSGLIRKALHVINTPIVRICSNGRFACSKAAGKWMFGKAQFDVIPNAVDASRFSFNEQIREKTREKYNLGDAFVIGHVGRFQEQKNHKFIVKLFAEYHRINPKSKLLLIGDGELFNDIKEGLEAANAIQNTVFIRETKSIEEYYQAMDLLVFPSLFEGFGTVAIEAQFSGLPCLLSEFVCRDTEISDRVKYLGIEDKDIPQWIKEIELISQEKLNRLPVFKNNDYDVHKAIHHFEECLRRIR